MVPVSKKSGKIDKTSSFKVEENFDTKLKLLKFFITTSQRHLEYTKDLTNVQYFQYFEVTQSLLKKQKVSVPSDSFNFSSTIILYHVAVYLKDNFFGTDCILGVVPYTFG